MTVIADEGGQKRFATQIDMLCFSRSRTADGHDPPVINDDRDVLADGIARSVNQAGMIEGHGFGLCRKPQKCGGRSQKQSGKGGTKCHDVFPSAAVRLRGNVLSCKKDAHTLGDVRA
ncbi:hypothetical protein Gbfr_006_063 [Gluconobacter frateurii M-2]|nr:hypothetical protein Gbfr_006_063 [Gluconobacter frateurii M-2]